MLKRLLVLQAIIDCINICRLDDKDNKALNVVTSYMELTIELTNIYNLSCINININDNHIIENDVLTIEPVVGREIEIPLDHIINCSVIDL